MAGLGWTPGPAPSFTVGVFDDDQDGNGGASTIPSVGFFASGYSAVATLYLPAPIKGDMTQLLAKGELYRNRHGALLTGSTKHRSLYKLTLTFVSLLDDVIDRVKILLASSNGTQMDYVDHRGNIFRGFIMNPDAKCVKQGRESNNVTIEFEGILV